MHTLQDVALGYNELYLSCISAGFTEEQALYLTGQCWAANIISEATRGD